MITEVTKLLGIQYPVIQGGMAWVAEHHLAAAVSEAGGLGLIGASAAPAEWVRNEIREAKKLTDKPFGVNIMLMSPYADEVAKVVAEEGVKVVTTGAGNPEKYMELWKNAGIRVIPAGIHDTDQFTGIIRTPIPRETIVDTDLRQFTCRRFCGLTQDRIIFPQANHIAEEIVDFFVFFQTVPIQP